MTYLYNEANYFKGLVMDTDNLTEHYLGFFTIHGDVCDFNPIGGLWKHEVYELAQYLYNEYYQCPFGSDGDKHVALEHALNIRPTDGNGVNDLGDMGQIAPAFAYCKNVDAYTKVDDIIKTYLTYKSDLYKEAENTTIEALYNEYGKETVDGIIRRINSTEYKRKKLPIVIERNHYEFL